MDHTELAQKFFEKIINGWMLSDLENMVNKIPPTTLPYDPEEKNLKI